MPNFYEVLNVTENASDDDIRKAYRKLSMQYHPDRNPGKDTSEDMQRVNEAYEVIGDKENRKKYDHELKYGTSIGNPFDDMNDLNNIFNSFFGGAGFPMGGFPGMPPGMGGPNIRIFHNGVQVNPHMFIQKPEPLHKTIHLTLEQSYSGANIPIEIERTVNQRKETETFYLNIPKGIDSNEQIVLQEKGHCINDMKGELVVNIQLVNNTDFKRSGLDLIYNKKVTLKESLCGFTFDIVHLNGKRLALSNINNPTIIKPFFKKIVPGMGMTRDTVTGNMIIEFEIEFPDTLTPEQTEQLSTIL
jgi:DnaJ-class molecular chaperone